MLTITDFKDILLSKAGGKPLGKVPNFYSMLYQAMVAMKSDIDIPSAIRTTQLVNPIYSQIDTYALPSDISLGGIINLRPIIADDSFYDFNRQGQRQFGIEKKYGVSNKYATKNNNGQEFLQANLDVASPYTLLACDTVGDSDVTVVSHGTALNTAVDPYQKIAGYSSIKFTAGIGSTNGIKATYTTAKDLSTYNDFLFYVYLPTLTNVTGASFVLGDFDGGNYYTASTAYDFFGNSLKVGWNLVRFNKDDFGVVGIPSWLTVTQALFLIDGAMVAEVENFRIDSVTAQNGALYEIDYYSLLQFQTLDGVRISKPTADTDYIVLNEQEELNIFLGYFLEILAVDLKQTGAVIDVQLYGGKVLEKQVEDFKVKFPSQRQLPQTNYGKKPLIQ